jgi:hypothetical protein
MKAYHIAKELKANKKAGKVETTLEGNCGGKN